MKNKVRIIYGNQSKREWELRTGTGMKNTVRMIA
jgi:hypothetical protein